MSKSNKKKMWVSSLLVAVLMVSLLTTVYAVNYDRTYVAKAGLHSDLTGYQSAPRTSYILNKCTDVKQYNSDIGHGYIGPSVNALWDYWVDQDGSSILENVTMKRNTEVRAEYSKTPSGSNVKARCSTRGFFEGELLVYGDINFSAS